MNLSAIFATLSVAAVTTLSSTVDAVTFAVSTNNATYANWMDPTNVAPNAFDPELCPGGIRINQEDLLPTEPNLTGVVPMGTAPTPFLTPDGNCTVLLLPAAVQTAPTFAAPDNRYSVLFFATNCDFKFMTVKSKFAYNEQTAAQVIDLTKDEFTKLSQETTGFSVKSIRADSIDPGLFRFFEFQWIDFCPTADGVDCGEIDSDGDGVFDLCDTCPHSANGETQKEDADGDLVADACDNCEDVSNADQLDTDKDSFGDVCDNCPNKRNRRQRDRDGDGVGDKCDNCKRVENPDQEDADADRVGDLCDNCDKFNPSQRDRNHDGVGDVCQLKPRHRGIRRGRRHGGRGGNDDDDNNSSSASSSVAEVEEEEEASEGDEEVVTEPVIDSVVAE